MLDVTLSQAVQAYLKLEEMIVKATLAPGARVSEKMLSEMTGFGRTPIREALQRLAAEGTVRIVPRSGVIISEIDITEQLHLIEVRRELEKMLAGRAARLATLQEREEFAALAERFRKACETGDVEIFIPADHAFNDLVVAAAHNKYALFAMSPIQAQTRRFWFMYFSRFGDLCHVSKLHADMAEAIAASDEARARQAAEVLVDYVEQYTRRTLEAICT